VRAGADRDLAATQRHRHEHQPREHEAQAVEGEDVHRRESLGLLLHEGRRVAAPVARAVGLAGDAAVRTEQRGDCPHVAAVTGDPDLAGVDGRIASRLVGDEVGALDLVCKHTHHLSLCIIRPVGGLANVYL